MQAGGEGEFDIYVVVTGRRCYYFLAVFGQLIEG
jgi:hypothetical protein